MTKTGLIFIDKPAGITSFKAIAKVRNRLGIKKIGHAGTLDLFATGLLVVATGSATKALTHLILSEKTYFAEITFGVHSPTLDIVGQLDFVDRKFQLPQNELLRFLDQMTGTILQKPPDFSALKIRGKRASDRVMEGETVELAPRPVRVLSIKLIETGIHDSGLLSGQQFARLRLSVGSGFYVRSLARDLGAALGTAAMCSNLRRESVGQYSVQDATLPDQVEPHLVRRLQPADFTLPKLFLEPEVAADLYSGKQVPVSHQDEEVAAIFLANQWIGFGSIHNGVLQPNRVVLPEQET